MLRTITAMLVSSEVPVCVDAIPIPAATNEMGHYLTALAEVTVAYASIDLFRVVMYDAGACSETNARGTRALGVHYVMVLNEAQPTLFAEAQRVLSVLGEDAATIEVEDQGIRYTLWVTEGVGFVQRRGGPIEVIRAGDRVVTEPDEEHWHGAAPNHFMSHLAMQEADDSGTAAVWGEHVSDEEYGAAPDVNA